MTFVRTDSQFFLDEEVPVLASFFMPENEVYSVELHKPQLTYDVLEELMEHFLDPVSGSNAKGRRVLVCMLMTCL